MKLYHSEHHYNRPWTAVTSAMWQKYPNPLTPHVLSVDVIARSVKDHILTTQRLITVRQPMPAFILRLFNSSATEHMFLETSEINLHTQQLIAVSTNLSHREYLVMDEMMCYSKHDALNTKLVQEAQINCNISGVSNYLEDLLIRKFNENAKIGRQALTNVMDRICLDHSVYQHFQHLAPASS